MDAQKKVGKRAILQLMLGGMLAYLCVWLAAFGLLKQAQQGWGFLYDQQQSAVSVAAEVSELPTSEFVRQRPDPWPREKVAVVDGAPPDSASWWVGDLLATRHRVVEEKERMRLSIDAQLNYSAEALLNLKRRS